MTYITQLTGRTATLGFQIMAMAFVVFAMLLLQSSSVQAQWTTPDAQGNINNTNTGNVGIGTATPDQKLSVNGNISLPANGLIISAWDYGNYFKPFETATGRMVFRTAATDRLSILYNGNVGIGTTSPSRTLDVAGNTKLNNAGIGDVGFGGGFAGFAHNSAFATGTYALIQNYTGSETYLNAASGGLIGFRINNSNKAVINASGNFGIGTTAPNQKLDVQGGLINASGGLCIGGDCKTSWSQVGVASVFGRTGEVVAAANDYTWAQINKSTSSLADLTTRSAGDLSSGTLPDGRFPATLPALSGVNLTNLHSSNLTSGTVPTARLGSGTANNTTFLRGDNSWAAIASSQWTTNDTNINYAAAGNVGIGTDAPSTKLHVAGGTRIDGANGRVYLGTGAVTGARGLEFIEENATTFSIRHHDPNVAWRNIAINPHGGNVGIGTTSPGTKLDVSGNIWTATAGNARNAAYDVGANQIGANTSIYSYGKICAGNSLGTCAGTGGVVISPTSIKFPDGTEQTTAVSSQWTSGSSNSISYSSGNVGIGVSSSLGVRLTVGRDLELDSYNDGTTRWGVIQGYDRESATSRPLWFEGSKFYFNGGNVGIGTVNPTEALEVTGNIKVGGTINAKYQDMAEWVESSQALAAGTVVVLDHTRSNQVVASSHAYDTRVAGVISLQPGITLGETGVGKVLVATTGRVRIKVDATAGPIQIGDLLVTSDVPGVAMKSEPIKVSGRLMHMPGTLIGKALEPLEKGSKEILVLLSLQ